MPHLGYVPSSLDKPVMRVFSLKIVLNTKKNVLSCAVKGCGQKYH